MLERYNEIWSTVRNLIKTEFDCEPVYNDKYLKSRMKSYEGKVNTNCHNDKMPKEDSHCICLSVINWLFLKWVKTIKSSVFRRM